VRCLALLALAALLCACGSAGDDPSGKSQAALVEDRYAYHVGVLAYLYGYPLVDEYRRAHNAGLRAGDVNPVTELDPMQSLGFFEVLNLLLRSRAPAPGTQALMTQFDAIGVGPGASFSQSSLSPARKRGLERAIRDARMMLEAAQSSAAGPGEDLLSRAAAYRAVAD
jgi:hypothetical protein